MHASFVYRLLQDGKLPLSRQALKKQIKGNAKTPPRNYFLIPLNKKIKLPNSLFGQDCLVLTSHLSVFEYFDVTVLELNVLHHTLKCQLGNQRFSIHVYYDENAVYIGYRLDDVCPIALLDPTPLRQLSAQMCAETAKKLLTTAGEEFQKRSDTIEQELVQLEMLSRGINFDCPQDRKRYQQPANHLLKQMDDIDPYRTQKEGRHQLFRSMIKEFNSKQPNVSLAQTTEQHYQQLIASVSAKIPVAEINPIQSVLTELKTIEELIELAEEASPSLNYTAALSRLQEEKLTEVQRLFTESLRANDLESTQQLAGYIKKISMELFFEVVSRNYIELSMYLFKHFPECAFYTNFCLAPLIDQHYIRLLRALIYRDQIELFEFFITQGILFDVNGLNLDGNTELWEAARLGKSKFVDVLLRHGASVKLPLGPIDIKVAIPDAGVEFDFSNIIQPSDISPLAMAACSDSVATLDVFVQHGVDISQENCDGLNLISAYVMFKKERRLSREMLNYLLAHGVDINQSFITAKGCSSTPLCFTCQQGERDNTALLLELNADLNITHGKRIKEADAKDWQHQLTVGPLAEVIMKLVRPAISETDFEKYAALFTFLLEKTNRLSHESLLYAFALFFDQSIYRPALGFICYNRGECFVPAVIEPQPIGRLAFTLLAVINREIPEAQHPELYLQRTKLAHEYYKKREMLKARQQFYSALPLATRLTEIATLHINAAYTYSDLALQLAIFNVNILPLFDADPGPHEDHQKFSKLKAIAEKRAIYLQHRVSTLSPQSTQHLHKFSVLRRPGWTASGNQYLNSKLTRASGDEKLENTALPQIRGHFNQK